MEINWSELESKWRARWSETRDFETDPNDRPKKFITVAYPYPNSPQHIGHGRTYTIADIHARFYRMKGYNVLFPMGFHYTGTPILGMARRIESNDKEIMDALRNVYHVPEKEIKTFVEPIKIAEYFHEEIKSGMIEMGYSIDWRREFTTITPAYQRFIEWQINMLKEKNLIIQGSHPVGWCPHDQNPVSQHDTLGDVEPDFTEYTLIKFKWDDYIIPTATLRPETIFGVTNLWVNPGITYKKITVDGERWIVSKECARKLEFLDREVTYDGEIAGVDLIGRYVCNPHRDQPIPILEAGFVKSNTGTGLVMSVPAHAPFDYQALMDLKADQQQPQSSEFQLIKPISIISTKGYGEFPAREACERLKIRDQNDPRLEEATKEVYAKEFSGGTFKDNCGEFAGENVSESRDVIKEWAESNNYSDILLELTNVPLVKCRCGTECVVKVLRNQWFLNYGDSDWKSKATECFNSMKILPKEIQREFHYIVGWLQERACARQHGLGTRLPWDKDWIVESLSDSVIYMAYYTISRFVNDGTIKAENLSKEFFDHIFLGEGSADKISGIASGIVRQIREEFAYFYPVDSRHSGRDLVPNHLTFFVFNHVAIFPKDKWPQQIVVNGSVLMDGKKMSKSMGNIIPLRKAIQDQGADPIRLAIIISAELLQDADFNMESVSGIQSKLRSMLEQASRIDRAELADLRAEDRWILSKLQRLIENVTINIEKMRLREALHDNLYSFESDLLWYTRRREARGRMADKTADAVIWEILTKRVQLLSPFAPHVAEEIWERLGQTGLVSRSQWPEYSKEDVDATSIQAEAFLRYTMKDIDNIIKVTKITPQKIIIYVNADGFKSIVYRKILGMMITRGAQNSMGVVMKELIADPETTDAKKMPDFVQKTIKDILSEPTEIREAKFESRDFDEKDFLIKELTGLVEQEFGVEIQIFSETDKNIYDPRGRAGHARPFKPAILIE